MNLNWLQLVMAILAAASQGLPAVIAIIKAITDAVNAAPGSPEHATAVATIHAKSGETK